MENLLINPSLYDKNTASVELRKTREFGEAEVVLNVYRETIGTSAVVLSRKEAIKLATGLLTMTEG